MPEYLFLMRNDAPKSDSTTYSEDWESYIDTLIALDKFQGGSAIGTGLCARKSGPEPAITAYLSGITRVVANDLGQSRSLLAGNPVLEAGGTVEIRELPRSE